MAAVLGAVALAEAVAALALAALLHQLTISNVGGGFVAALAFGAVGVVVARHRPSNPVGWLLILFTVLNLLATDAGHYAVYCYRLGHRGLPLAPVAVLLVQMWAPAFALLALVLLLFPDGRLTSPRWRWILWTYAALVGYGMAVVLAPPIAAVAGHDIHLDSSGDVTSRGHPGGWIAHPPAWLVAAVIAALGAICVSFVAHQVLAWRRATGERRQQLKWLTSGAVVTVGLAVLGAAVSSGVVAQIAGLGFAVLPVSIGVGILKYRLYEIDRIISRTLAYAIVTGLLVGVYAGLVLLATQVLSFHTPVAVAVATLSAAALFNPLRRRVQQIVDRRFNRARYDAEQIAAAFAARLKDAVDLDSVRDDLARTAHQALEPAHVSVWVSRQG